jgi:hypothetical protein
LFNSIKNAVATSDTNKIVSHFLPDGFWRDLVSLSWDFRTLRNPTTIKAFLDDGDRLKSAGLELLELDGAPALVKANEDFTWIQCFFNFETKIARGRGFFRLMADDNGTWKAK